MSEDQHRRTVATDQVEADTDAGRAMDTRLEDRHVIVTGAARGIGQGIALRCAQAGADISIFDVRADEAIETQRELEEVGCDVENFEVDVSDPEAVQDGVEAARGKNGPIHGLVNNAGIQLTKPILKTTVEEWDRQFEVNARGQFLCAKHTAAQMIEDECKGAIINIGSVGVDRPFPGQGAYAASKGAIPPLTTVLSKELSTHDIRANTIHPGSVSSPMLENVLARTANETGRPVESIEDEALTRQTIERFGKPVEIGHVVVMLLSIEGRWITGASIPVDGGYLQE